jgi:hypothetical protein
MSEANWAGNYVYGARKVHRPSTLQQVRNFTARPHWAKVFLADATGIGPLYERLTDFARLAESLDPRRAFRNSWLRKRVLGVN